MYLAFGIPNYILNRTADAWDDNCVYRHFNVVNEPGEKVSDMIIFEKNDTKKMFLSKA
jgi:hypothetical protein